MNFGKICWIFALNTNVNFPMKLQSEEIRFRLVSKSIMTIVAINSKAYRKISLKAENICRAKKNKTKQLSRKKLWESTKWKQQPRTPHLKSSNFKVFKSIHTRILSWVSSPREKRMRISIRLFLERAMLIYFKKWEREDNKIEKMWRNH